MLLLAMLGMQGMAAYVFPNVYRSTQAQSAVSLLSSVAILVICAPLASKLAAKFGKKELSTVSCIFGAACYVVCLIVHPDNVWVYVLFYVLSFIGLGFFNTVIWAMITDVIDDSEVKNGIREDGTIYAVYSFARKLGQHFLPV
ncbi:MAG: MFS transporter [Blautia sp.]